MALLDARFTTISLSLYDNYYGDWNYGVANQYGYGYDASIEVATTTQFTEIVGYYDQTLRATWRGTGFTYGEWDWAEDGSTDYVAYPVTGTATSLTLEDTSRDIVYTLTGFSLSLDGVTEGPSWSLLLQGNDTIRAGGGDDELAGYDGNDLLEGNLGSDTLSGGLGTDTLDGGDGFDFVDFEAQFSNVTLTLGAAGAATTAVNGEGNDVVRKIEGVFGGSGNDSLTGNELNNALLGGSGNDTLNGGAGDDTIEGGWGTDSLAGGTGIDTLSFAQAYAAISVNLGTSTVLADESGVTETATSFENVLGSGGSDSIVGSTAANMLLGHYGNDTISGLAGNDTLVGVEGYYSDIFGARPEDAYFYDMQLPWAGYTPSGYGQATDSLVGGAGNDYYVIGHTATGYDSMTGTFLQGAWDQVVENGPATDVDTVEAIFMSMGGSSGNTMSSYALGGNVENLVLNTKGIYASSYGLQFAGAGNALANQIRVEANDLAYGNDSGEGGNYYPPAPTNSYKLYGMGGNDSLWGAAGSDTLNGGAGTDYMEGFDGNDTYMVDSVGDVVVEELGGGNDTIVTLIDNINLASHWQVENVRLAALSTVLSASGSELDNTMKGNQFANTLLGLGGEDFLFGGGGNDTLQGGDGDDLLSGDTGNDLLDGGAGFDFADYSGAGVALTIDLRKTTAQNTGLGNDTFISIENVSGGQAADVIYGNGVANDLYGEGGADKLYGLGGDDMLYGDLGNDTLQGGAGSDTLFGGYGGRDLFVFEINQTASSIYDVVFDFESGQDVLAISGTAFGVGNGDAVIDNGTQHVTVGAPFAQNAELVVFSRNVIDAFDTVAVASHIGTANAAFNLGDKRLFAVDDGDSSAVYLFTSAGTDATVSAGELKLVVELVGAPATQLVDYSFAV